jgi:hypothetical protein
MLAGRCLADDADDTMRINLVRISAFLAGGSRGVMMRLVTGVTRQAGGIGRVCVSWVGGFVAVGDGGGRLPHGQEMSSWPNTLVCNPMC